MRRVVGALALGLLGMSSQAAPRPPDAAKKTVVRFDGDDIDGRLEHPDGTFLSGRGARAGGPLARPPADFEQEAHRLRIEAAEPRAGGRR